MLQLTNARHSSRQRSTCGLQKREGATRLATHGTSHWSLSSSAVGLGPDGPVLNLHDWAAKSQSPSTTFGIREHDRSEDHHINGKIRRVDVRTAGRSRRRYQKWAPRLGPLAERLRRRTARPAPSTPHHTSLHQHPIFSLSGYSAARRSNTSSRGRRKGPAGTSIASRLPLAAPPSLPPHPLIRDAHQPPSLRPLPPAPPRLTWQSPAGLPAPSPTQPDRPAEPVFSTSASPPPLPPSARLAPLFPCWSHPQARFAKVPWKEKNATAGTDPSPQGASALLPRPVASEKHVGTAGRAVPCFWHLGSLAFSCLALKTKPWPCMFSSGAAVSAALPPRLHRSPAFLCAFCAWGEGRGPPRVASRWGIGC
jgi:hypothetical protein